jgi:TonB family protein
MLRMRMLAGLAICSAFCATSQAQDKKAGGADLPDRFEVGRHTFFDFGPPNDYYEIFIIRPALNGTSTVARVLLTPRASCLAPAKTEFTTARLDAPVAELLKRENPCAIPEKDLQREAKRCKHCLVFSGANVSMQVVCGSRTRIINAKVLEQDWFEKTPNTPPNTRWTMDLLDRLDKATGPGVMDKPMFQMEAGAGPSATIPDDEISNDLSSGKYDGLFADAPDKASALYLASQQRPADPVVRVVTVEPVAPVTVVQPRYPPIARLAHVEGLVSVSFDVNSSGSPENLSVEGGPGLLYGSVTTAVQAWTFPVTSAGQRIHATIQFDANCPSPAR